jgi:hypothetical protein
MPSSDSKPSGFTVTDRRSFTDEAAKTTTTPTTAQPRAEGNGAEPPAPAADDADEGQAAAERAAHAATGLPPVDFHTFVLSLGSSALLHLGELEHPDGGQAEKDLPLAKHTIDILSMLEQKTRGNLTPAEERLMESLLYDLRLRYVNASK